MWNNDSFVPQLSPLRRAWERGWDVDVNKYNCGGLASFPGEKASGGC